MLFYVILSRGLSAILLFFSLSLCAMDLPVSQDLDRGQKRTRQVYEKGKTVDQNKSPLKKIKTALNSYPIPSPNSQYFYPIDYPIHDIWERIGSFLKLTDFQSLRCVCWQTNKALKWGGGLFYEYSFDRPPEYVINLMNVYPALQLGITVLGKKLDCNTNLDFVLRLLKEYNLCLMSQLPNREKLKEGVIYVEKDSHHLKYTLLDSKGILVDDVLPIKIDEELSHENLDSLKSQILTEIFKKDRTLLPYMNLRNRLKSLNLDCNIDSKKKCEIFNSISNIKTNDMGLEEFLIEAWDRNYNNILIPFFESPVFKNLKSLCLAISFVKFNRNRTIYFLRTIENSHNLEYLSFYFDLSRADDTQFYFDDWFFKEFPLSLSKNYFLKTLNFKGCHFELEQVPHILRIMEMANATLTTLILDNNLFGLEGMSLILEENADLKRRLNKGVKCISLNNISSSTELEDEIVLDRFLMAIKNDSLLTSLTLGGGIFLDILREFAFFPHILQALSENQSLQKLCLHSMRFNEFDKNNILLFFQNNKSLKRLELFSCFDRKKPNDFFIECLYQNTSLQEIFFDDSTKDMFGDEKMKIIDQILYRNLFISLEKAPIEPMLLEGTNEKFLGQ